MNMRRLLSILSLFIVLAAGSAEAAPFGCFGHSDVCVAPALSVGLVSYNLATHEIGIGAMPIGAAGLEVTAWTSQWFRSGISINAAAAYQSKESNWLALAFVASFAEYLRIGAMVRTVGESAQWSLLGGIGIGGGSP